MTKNNIKVFSLLFLVLVFGQIAFAQVVDVNLRNRFSDYHINTRMSANPAIVLSTAATNVIGSANPNDLPSGAQICSGASVSVNVRNRITWAAERPDIVSIFPICTSGACPTTNPFTGFTNSQVNWLRGSAYSTYSNFNDDPSGGDFAFGSEAISDLAALGGSSRFSAQSVTYNTGRETFTNREARVGLFCSGTYEILIDTPTGPSGSSGQISGDTTTTSISSARVGTYLIGATLNDVTCFGALYNPADIGDSGLARMYYYTRNKPTLSSSNIVIKSIQVQNADPSTIPPCSMTSGTPVRVASLGSRTLVRVAISNDGTTPIDLSSSLTSSNSQYTIRPMQVSPTNECEQMALAYAASGQAVDFICPVENGFERSLGSRTSRSVYLTVDRVGVGGGTLVSRLSAQGSAVCGTRPNCNRDIPLTGIVPGTGESRINCQVYTTAPGSPNFVTIGPGEIATVGVQCTNSTTGAVVDCPTNDWTLNRSGSGSLGTIIESNNRNARFTVGSVGPTGQIIYNTGTSTCAAPISTMNPQYRCAFNPPSATMVTLESRRFDLRCTNNEVVIPPSSIPSARYSAEDGLSGFAVGSGVNNAEAAIFTSSAFASTGNLVGDISINPDTIRPYITGIRPVALVSVTLDDTTTATSCAITPSALTIGTLELGRLRVECRNRLGAIVPCVGSDWRLNGIGGGFEVGQSSSTETIFYTTSSAGSSGTVEYRYASRTDVSCTSAISVVAPIFSCTLSPPSATLNTADTQRFALNCIENRGTPTPRTPEDARYSQSSTLFGMISLPSVSGATFTAGTPSSGLFFGVGLFTDTSRPDIVGAIAQAPVTIRGSGPEVICTMNPGVMQLGAYEVATATLLCTNRVGAAVPCSGNYNFNGLTGSIIPGRVPGPNQFSFFIENGAGLSGNLQFLVDNDPTNTCAIQINTIEPVYDCALTPDSVRVGVGNTTGLDLSCTVSGSPRLPDKAEYHRDPALFIRFTNPSLTGVNITGEDRSSGYAYGIGVFSDPTRPYLTGAVGLSKIAVDAADGGCTCPTPTSFCTDGTAPRCTLTCDLTCNPDDDGNNRRRNEFCTLNNGAPLQVYPSSRNYVEILCGSGNPRVPGYNECSVVEWSVGGDASATNQSATGAILIPLEGIGSSGRIIANVTVGGRRGGCESDFVVQNPSCLRVS